MSLKCLENESSRIVIAVKEVAEDGVHFSSHRKKIFVGTLKKKGKDIYLALWQTISF